MVFLLLVPLIVAIWHFAAWSADVTLIPHPLESRPDNP